MVLSIKFRTVLPVAGWPDVALCNFEPEADYARILRHLKVKHYTINNSITTFVLQHVGATCL